MSEETAHRTYRDGRYGYGRGVRRQHLRQKVDGVIRHDVGIGPDGAFELLLEMSDVRDDVGN